jgi:hypothetical protein
MRARIYEQVFTGTVQSVVEISFTDRRLTIVPDEVFLGDVTRGEVIASVNQACLPEEFPEIKAGDKWVLYLKTKKYLHPDANPPYISTDGLMVAFDSPAKPVTLAKYDICFLRHHSDDDESCGEPPPRRSMFSCILQSQPFSVANPFSRSASLQQLPIALPLGGIKLKVIPPPEFRGNNPRPPRAEILLDTPRPCSPGGHY